MRLFAIMFVTKIWYLSSQLYYIVQSFYSIILLPSHLTSSTASKLIWYSGPAVCATSIHRRHFPYFHSYILAHAVLSLLFLSGLQYQNHPNKYICYGVRLSGSHPTPNLYVHAINKKIFFLNRLLLWGVILDLDKYIFPWQTCFLEGSS
jgi:hypothetical protein